MGSRSTAREARMRGWMKGYVMSGGKSEKTGDSGAWPSMREWILILEGAGGRKQMRQSAVLCLIMGCFGRERDTWESSFIIFWTLWV